MSSTRFLQILAVFSTFAVAAQTPSARGIQPITVQRRVALVIGNEAYLRARLQNPVNDAKAMEAALQGLGFSVRRLSNVDKREFDAAVDAFAGGLKPGDLAFFYFSGHGIQVARENYLVPVGFAATHEVDAKRAAKSADQIQERLEASGARLRVMVLDACRDNPFRTTRSLGGLAAMAASVQGTLISFATAGNGVADDNPGGKNGLFTEHLLRNMQTPGAGLREVFVRTREGVYEASGQKQLPSIYENVIGELILRDPAEELARITRENAAMESELARLREQSQKAKTEAERLEAGRREERARFEKSELERRQIEARQRLAAQREGERVEAARATAREAARVKSERLRRDLEKEKAGEMTLEEARREVAALEAEVQKATADLDREKAAELAGLQAQRPVKDQFESTAEFQGRLRIYEAGSANREAANQRTYSTRLAGVTGSARERIRTLKERRFSVKVALRFIDYDADSQRLALADSEGNRFRAKIAPSQARLIRDRLDQMVGSRSASIGGSSTELILKNPETSEEWKFEAFGRKNPIDGLTYARIPSGTFLMGCSPGDKECESDEKPPKSVTLTRGFWLGETEVTQEAFQKVMGNNPSYFQGKELPVESVTWEEARRYCEKVGGRLPTEAEWEWAARGGSPSARHGEVDRVGWHSGNSSGKTHPVKGKLVNGYGLYDMLGNVDEWTADWYQHSMSGGTDPTGPNTGEYRTQRGGSYHEGDSRYLRASYRGRNLAFRPSNNYGFRCAWD